MKKPVLLLLTVTCAAALTTVPAALAADLSGRFNAGTKYEAPDAHAPANVSRMYVRTLERTERTQSVELPAAGGSGMIIWTVPARHSADAAVKTRLRTPNGSLLQPGDRGSLERGLRRFPLDAAETAEMGIGGGAHEVVHVMATAAASYHLDVDMPRDVAGVTVIAAEPDSALTLSTWAAPLSRQPGEPITLHAELRDGATAIPGARVFARLASPNGKSFAKIDLTEQPDGTYSAVVRDLPENLPGTWQVRFEADGTNERGARFARTGSGELVAERGAARLGEIRTEVVGDALRVRASVDVVLEGAYRFDVLAADGSSNAVAWGEGVRTLSTGATELSLDIPLAHLGSTRVEDLFLDVRLLGLDVIGVAGRVTKEVD
ncbi:MAG TPA: hypothetical protein VFV49_17335 [Thermoanaerobaculia bacterium]|nr:hypothetical protein [Thermoanaerobaculia bacterium]